MDYNLNSDKARQKESEKEKTTSKKVVQDRVTVKKKVNAKKAVRSFIETDANTVASHVVMDILVPGIKEMIAEIVKSSIDMLLFQEVRRDNKNTSGTKFEYSNFYNGGNSATIRRTTGSVYDYEELEFASRRDADAVLDALEKTIAQYDLVTVAELYEFANVPTNNISANKYGWSNIRRARVERLRNDKYIIVLPRAEPIY